MPRLIWVFAGRTFILLVLSCRGSVYTWSFPMAAIRRENINLTKKKEKKKKKATSSLSLPKIEILNVQQSLFCYIKSHFFFFCLSEFMWPDRLQAYVTYGPWLRLTSFPGEIQVMDSWWETEEKAVETIHVKTQPGVLDYTKIVI